MGVVPPCFCTEGVTESGARGLILSRELEPASNHHSSRISHSPTETVKCNSIRDALLRILRAKIEEEMAKV